MNVRLRLATWIVFGVSLVDARYHATTDDCAPIMGGAPKMFTSYLRIEVTGSPSQLGPAFWKEEMFDRITDAFDTVTNSTCDPCQRTIVHVDEQFQDEDLSDCPFSLDYVVYQVMVEQSGDCTTLFDDDHGGSKSSSKGKSSSLLSGSKGSRVVGATSETTSNGEERTRGRRTRTTTGTKGKSMTGSTSGTKGSGKGSKARGVSIEDFRMELESSLEDCLPTNDLIQITEYQQSNEFCSSLAEVVEGGLYVCFAAPTSNDATVYEDIFIPTYNALAEESCTLQSLRTIIVDSKVSVNGYTCHWANFAFLNGKAGNTAFPTPSPPTGRPTETFSPRPTPSMAPSSSPTDMTGSPTKSAEPSAAPSNSEAPSPSPTEYSIPDTCPVQEPLTECSVFFFSRSASPNPVCTPLCCGFGFSCRRRLDAQEGDDEDMDTPTSDSRQLQIKGSVYRASEPSWLKEDCLCPVGSIDDPAFSVSLLDVLDEVYDALEHAGEPPLLEIVASLNDLPPISPSKSGKGKGSSMLATMQDGSVGSGGTRRRTLEKRLRVT